LPTEWQINSFDFVPCNNTSPHREERRNDFGLKVEVAKKVRASRENPSTQVEHSGKPYGLFWSLPYT
jgi:hypothetical protein